VNVAVRAVAQFPAFYFELADELSLAGSTNEAAACRRKAATALAELPPEQVGDPNQRAQAYLRGVWLLLEADQVNDAKVLRGKLLSLEQLDPSSLNQIAWLLATRLEDGIRDSSSAIRFAQRAVAATSRTNANILDTLAAAYAEAGDFTNAVIVQQETVSLVTNASKKIEYTARLRLYESGMPYRNPESLGWRALKLLEAGQFAEAERLAREYLALSEKELPNGWQKFDAHGLLGGSLSGQKKYGEAEPLLRSSYEGMWQREDEIPRPIRPRLKEALVRLTQLCEATGRPDEAAQWRQKLVELAQHEAQRKP
jgi:TolA-binding protein